MGKIQYLGPSDARELDAADLKKSDVEGHKKTTFRRGEAVEVDESIAAAILDNEDLYGKFARVESDTQLPDPGQLTEQQVTATRTKK